MSTNKSFLLLLLLLFVVPCPTTRMKSLCHSMTNLMKEKETSIDETKTAFCQKQKDTRLHAVLFGVDQALNLVLHENDDEPSWSFEIPCEFMQRAIHLMDFWIAQKFALGKPAFKPPPAIITNTDSVQPPQIDEHRIKRLLELPSPISVTHNPLSYIKESRTINIGKKKQKL